MSLSPRVSAPISFACLPDDPRKMRGFTRWSVPGAPNRREIEPVGQDGRAASSLGSRSQP
jgi:hypothetical protein